MCGFEAFDRGEPEAVALTASAADRRNKRAQRGCQDRALGVAPGPEPGQAHRGSDEGSYAGDGEEFERRVVGAAGLVVAAVAGRVGEKRGKQPQDERRPENCRSLTMVTILRGPQGVPGGRVVSGGPDHE